jgi:polar amino acid transport system substrate-binding protein
MKKILALALALVMCMSAFAMTACAPNPAEDWENIKAEGKFIVGMTLFEPINYKDDSGKLIGFDTEFAQAVAAYLGVSVEFQEIEWSQKYSELKSGAIDCVWNGFTSNSSDDGVARKDKVDFATGYANNFQCVVVNSDKIDVNNFTLASLSGKTCAVEDGSAGASYAKTITGEDKVVNKSSQIEAFTELKAGAVDFIVVDVLLANRTCGAGDYTKCVKAYEVTDQVELYAIGCRKGSNFDEKLNEAIAHLMNDGVDGGKSTLEVLSEKYGVPLSAEVLALKVAK